MKRSRLKRSSVRGNLIRRIDAMLSKIVRMKRGNICQVHNRKCHNLGAAHILDKGRYPRSRFVEENIIVAGWFCSHYWKHHNNEHEGAKDFDRAVIRLHGENWKDKLLILDRTQPKHTMTYLKALESAFTLELKMLEAGYEPVKRGEI